MEVVVIGITNDLAFDMFFSIFYTATAIMVPFTATLSLLKH
jgi:hypothetical protein